MAELAQARVDDLLDEAEKNGRCVTSPCPANRKALRTRASKSKVIEPSTNSFVRPEYWDSPTPEQRLRHVVQAMARRHPSWTFCFSTAALIHGLEVPRPLLKKIHINARGRAGHVHDDRLHIHAIRRMDRVTVDDIAVTDFWQTVADCMRTAPFSLSLAIADSALRLTGASQEELLGHIRRCGKGRPGRRRAESAVFWANGLAENGGESRVRAFLIERGYPLPRIQVELPDPLDPQHTFRVDFYWELPDGRIVIGEFDGAVKYKEDAGDSLASAASGRAVSQVLYERQRESRLTLLGFPVLRFTFDDLIHPEKLERLLAGVGITPIPGTDRDV